MDTYLLTRLATNYFFLKYSTIFCKIELFKDIID